MLNSRRDINPRTSVTTRPQGATASLHTLALYFRDLPSTMFIHCELLRMEKYLYILSTFSGLPHPKFTPEASTLNARVSQTELHAQDSRSLCYESCSEQSTR